MNLSGNLPAFKRSAAPAILFTALWLVIADNGGYWNLVGGLPAEAGHSAWFLVSVFVFSLALVNLLLTLVACGRATRWVLAALLVASAAAAHFMGQYGILLDDEMLGNLFETDRAEAMELLGPRLLLDVLLLGLLPAAVIWRLTPARQKLPRLLLDEMEKAIVVSTDDTVIVLHQNGSHGPAYYRRYPEEFRVFTPDCRSDDFGDCTREEIVNSYDNTIHYTDWFLAQVIDRLKGHQAQLDTAMLYVSDHGESLGEYGLYLHGRQAEPLSHDNLFHSVLGLLDVTTAARDAQLDLFDGCGDVSAAAGRALAR